MKRWGGARAGAGRPAKHAIASEPHKRRPEVPRGRPVHVIARVVAAVASLRGHAAYGALHHALARSLSRSDFRIVQLAVRGRRLELVVEADNRVALARGMQGFQIAAARALNRACDRTGAVFADRYRPRQLATRPALRAVLEKLAPAPAPSAAPASLPARPSGSPRAPTSSSPPVSPTIRSPASPPRRPPGSSPPRSASSRPPSLADRVLGERPSRRYVSLTWPRHALPRSWVLVAELARLVARRLR